MLLTCLHSYHLFIAEIECKWPEVDFRRAKAGDAARARKRSPAEPPTQRSPETSAQKRRGLTDIAADNYSRPLTALTSSQSVPMVSIASSSVPQSSSSTSPSLDRANRYRTHSDGDRSARYAESHLQNTHSPSDRHVPPLSAHESRMALYARPDGYARPYSSAGVPSSRHDSAMSWPRDDRADAHGRRTAWENQSIRVVRSLPEFQLQRATAAATRCRHRAAEIAVLARPASDAQRNALEAYMKRESSLEDLAVRTTAGERLDHAFAADWDLLGGLSHTARRPFMDVAAGIVGVVELTGAGALSGGARLHTFRLRNGGSTHPDLCHLSIAMDLFSKEERQMLESTASAYDTLSYPIPVDRLSLPLIDLIQRALAEHDAKASKDAKATKSAASNRSPIHAASLPSPDAIPFVRQQDVKPPQPVLELFFHTYVKAIGNQMPGLDTEVVGARVRDRSISALLANALCAIGASLYDRAGERPPVADEQSSTVYIDRARALIGAALQSPDLEAILALGVMAIRDILMGQMVSSAAIVSSAIRLCMQLDLHRARPLQHRKSSPVLDEATHPAPQGTDGGKAKKLVAEDVFWMTYCLDRITSIATARPFAIKDHDIDTDFPATLRKGEPCMFAALVRQLHYLGRLNEVASSKGGAATSGVEERERACEMELAAIGADLVGHYESLPSVLQLGSANVRRAHEKGESLSFLQLHLTHNMALLHRFLLSEAPMTNTEYHAMRSAARAIVKTCQLGEALDPTMLADTPLSAVACFLACCVLLAESESLEESMQAAPPAQLDLARSDLTKLMETMERHAKFWPVARQLVDVLETQMAHSSAVAVSPATLAALVAQVEAIHVLVRHPRETEAAERQSQNAVQVTKVSDLDSLRVAFPHLC